MDAMSVGWWILKGYMWLLSIHPLIYLVGVIVAGWLGNWKWALAAAIFTFTIFGPILFLPMLLPLLLRGVGWGLAKLDSMRPPEPAD